MEDILVTVALINELAITWLYLFFVSCDFH